MTRWEQAWGLFVVIGWYASGFVASGLTADRLGEGAAIFIGVGTWLLWWLAFIVIPDLRASKKRLYP